MEKATPYETAKQFIFQYYPNCYGAILAGSVVRGDTTSTSDLDIIVFDGMLPAPYRESLLFQNWPIEVFANNLTSYKQIFQSDYERAIPTHPKMIVEGVTIIDLGVITSIKREAKEFLEEGPEPWSKEKVDMKRYFLTDALDDFVGATVREEEIFIANTLAEWIHEFYLRTNMQWIGESKWIIRSLRNYDPDFADKFVVAFDEFYKSGTKEGIINIVDFVLTPYGGRYFHGFTMGKY
ncbi:MULTISPECIES: nucleotidyltransferase domain-containing protein [Bacillaceae]|uniref:Nucleotidyltransferase domain-containing protein n=1 Tax=Evansella alkalicola TaxID=745819 RepID=A0ABS6JW96_9BACI|nr:MULTISPECIES: nucleotidyltransferase domain-containing protein [Bacillaceae]MBU9722859.1 nucleotidyltransferase domain-containing protein [Bacillus alkalicola]